MDTGKDHSIHQEGENSEQGSHPELSDVGEDQPDVFVISSDDDEEQDQKEKADTSELINAAANEAEENDDEISDMSQDEEASENIDEEEQPEESGEESEEIGDDAMDVDEPSGDDEEEDEQQEQESHQEDDNDDEAEDIESSIHNEQDEPVQSIGVFDTAQFDAPQNLEDLANAAIDPLFAQIATPQDRTPNHSEQAQEEHIVEANEFRVESIEATMELIDDSNVTTENPVEPDNVEEPSETEQVPEEATLVVQENERGEAIEEDQEEMKSPQFEYTTVKLDKETREEQQGQTTAVEINEETDIPLDHGPVTVDDQTQTVSPSSVSNAPKTQHTTTIPESTVISEEIPAGPIELCDVSSFLNVDLKLVDSLEPSILEGLQAKVREFRSLTSEKVVLEVKLEQSSHIANKKVDLFKSQLTKSQTTNKELKEQITFLEKSKLEIRDKLETLESQISQSKSLKFQNQQQFDHLHSEKIRTLELLDKKNKEIEVLNSDLKALQIQTSELRKNVIQLETSNQSANSNFVHSNIKIQSLETQVDLINNNNDWLNKELNQMTEDFTDYRNQKSQEFTKLRTELDEKTNALNSLQLAHENLKERFSDVSSKADNALLKVKSLSDGLASTKEDFFKEISQKDRLVELLKSSTEDAKTKIVDLEEKLKHSRHNVYDHAAQLQTELNQYKLKLVDAESKVQSLETTLDELSSIHDESSANTCQLPGSKFPVTSLNQLHSDFTLMQKQLVLERRAKERLEKQINAFVAELEQKAPLINATKERANYLEEQLTKLSFVLETTTREKELLQNDVSDLTKQLQDGGITISALNRQKVDLARQVQSLLCQISVRGDTDGPLTPAEKQALARIAKGDFLQRGSDTDKLISERLVTFQNIIELQSKNEELLHIVRELGAKLENEEKTSKSKLETLENEAILEAKEAIITLQEEISSIESKLKSVTKERDMFRSMLADKPLTSSGNLLTTELSSHSLDGKQVASLAEKYEQSKAEAELLEDQLKQFKIEYETTVNLLNKQVSDLQIDRFELTTALAKERSSKELGEERYTLLQDNLRFSKSEAEEIRKRSHLLQENLSKHELRTQQITEELIQTRSSLDSLISETSNLKAEKKLWKSIESRLNDENTQLLTEKSRLSTLLLNLQGLEKEREVNTNDTQTRLLNQTRTLEAELAVAREKLSQSSAELNSFISKKDSESRVYQNRIDTLRSELSATREQLIEKKSHVKQLEEKVSTLSKKIQSSEFVLGSIDQQPASSSPAIQVSTDALRLARELEDTKLELDHVNASVTKFKSIATATEEALNNITTTFDQYKESISQKIASLELEKSKSTETTQSLNEQLNAVTEELSKQKADSTKEIQTLNAKIKILQTRAASSDKLKEEYDAKVAVLEESYQQQVSIANEAQQNYGKELQKHAQVSKAVSLLREESSAFKIQIQTLSAGAKAAKQDLETSRESWEAQKIDLEEELRVSKERVQDLNTQNQLLYSQIESLTKLPSTLSSIAVTPSGNGNTEELRELITLLRREKEISDAQLEIANRDLQRVRHQAHIANSELDSVKLELGRLRLQDTEREMLAKEHASLSSEVEQLNLLRESNVTLRNELQSNINRIKNLEAQLVEYSNKFEPLESEVSRLNAELQSKLQQVSLITEEKDRWKQRSQNILTKYDRIDPQEYSELKVEVESLKSKIAELNKSAAEEVVRFNEVSDKFERVKKEAQEKIYNRGRELKAVTAQLAESQRGLDELKKSTKAEIDSLNEQLKSSQSKNSDTESSVAVELARLSTALSEKETELNAIKAESNSKITALSAEVEELRKKSQDSSQTTLTATRVDEEFMAIMAEKEKELLALTQGEASAIVEVEDLKKNMAEKLNQLKNIFETRILPTQAPAPSSAEIAELKTTIIEKEKQLEGFKQQESKLQELLKINEDLTAKNVSLTKEIELVKQSEQAKGKGKANNIIKAKDLEISRHKEDLEKLKNSIDQKVKEVIKTKDSEVVKQRENLNKLRTDLNSKLQEAFKTNSTLTKEVESLKAKLNSTPTPGSSGTVTLPPIIEVKTDNNEWKDQIEKIKNQLAVDLKTRYDQALEAHKAKIRAPAEEKIKRVTDIRVKKLEDEYEAKIKEATAKLEKQYANAKSSESELEELKKKAFDEGREATKKEVAMRSKLLQAKTDKLNKEKKELEEKLKVLQEELSKLRSISVEPIVGQKRPADEETESAASAEKRTKRE